MPLTPKQIEKLNQTNPVFLTNIRRLAAAIIESKPTPALAYALRDKTPFESWPDEAIEAVARIATGLLKVGGLIPPRVEAAELEAPSGASSGPAAAATTTTNVTSSAPPAAAGAPAAANPKAGRSDRRTVSGSAKPSEKAATGETRAVNPDAVLPPS